MTTSNFTTILLANEPSAKVFQAILNVRGWWSEEIEGSTEKLNDVFTYRFQDVHRCTIKITEFILNRKLVWTVLDNYFSFTKDKSEWKGNTMVFELTERGDQTELRLTQVGLVPEYECFDICQNAWTTYIQKSLYSLITTGKGQPNGKEKPQTEDEKNLSAPNFTTTFFVNQTPAEVFNAVNNVRGWWQGEIEGSSSKLGDEFSYRMKDIHFSKQRLIDVILDKKIVWLVTDSNLSFLTNKTEWTGTKIVFDITEINNKTQLRFTHLQLVPEIECYDACSNAWGMLIQESLLSLVTTGKGKDIF
ncbi:MAG: SRPBCC domain-containing protein [Bacteroidota bacterium]